MSEQDDRPASVHLHPRVYALIVGLTLWLILSVWSFAADGYTDYLLAVVSVFLVIAVALPCVLWRVRQRNESSHTDQKDEGSFSDWASADFETWQGRLPGANAAAEILLPIAAVAFGMTAFPIVLHFTAHAGV